MANDTMKRFYDVNHESAEGAAWLVEHLKETAAEILATQGDLKMMAIIVGRRDPHTRMRTAKPNITPVLVAGLSDVKEMDAVGNEIRKIAKRADAIGVGLMAEAWTREKPLTESEYRRFRHDPTATLADDPLRVEVVSVTWEHRYAKTPRAGVLAPMLRDASGQFTGLGPWRVMPVSAKGLYQWIDREDA